MMKEKYIIIGDSSLDVNDELRDYLRVTWAPFTIDVNNKGFLDDGSVNIPELIEAIATDKNPAKTAAPSPNDFLKLMDRAEQGVFIVTISSKLSGSYNSAMIAKDIAKDRYPHLSVKVIDSLAASAGETTLAIHIRECIEKGMSFEEIAASAEAFRDNDKLYFLLDNIQTLLKNGRMSLLKGIFALMLHIKPILGDDGDGNIRLEDKSRTYSGALEKLAELFISTPLQTEERTLVIAQCNAIERAERLKSMVEEKRKYKSIVIVEMFALSSTYANDGGLVCAL